VVVDDATDLVLSNLDEPDPYLLAQLLLGDPEQAGQLAGEVDGEAAPQFRREGVEQDMPGVVVAVGAQRLAEPWIVRMVDAGTGDVAAMWAAALVCIAAGAAGQSAATSARASGVHGSEAGGGQGGEHARVRGHGFGHAFAAGQAGADDLPSIVLVDLRASGADVLAAVAAPDQEDLAGLAVGVIHDTRLPGRSVGGIDPAEEADRAGAVPGVSELGFPAVKVGPGGEIE
jgi:hypothetical protein